MLLEEIMKGYVIPTEYTRKLTVDGITQSYQVYQIRLDRLYYNDQNDRIATWINKYKEENNIVDFSEYNDEYNKIIEGFVCESNPKAIEKTKNNIELVGQREPGVVLNDGRIIDGNRRYTCLRKIHEKNHNINHFEAVILDRDIKENKKAIKLLELSIQHGEEGKVDYNPIDRLVGLYNDVIKNELITIDEYQKTDEEKENLKLIIFTNLLMKPKGDITRFIRKIKKVVDSEHVDDFIEEQLEFTEKTAEKIEELEGINSKVINKNIRSDELLQENMVQSLEKFEIKAKKDIAKMKPLQDLQKFYIILENLDVNLI
ncbi:Uncharacterised protein [Enterococcus durans]|uniref:ParB/Sulfiredoxin domain-containing protein n=1 Tax=Enterococcus durans TaxID=53345 RepID=A0A377KIU5_9ENTE|nr:hypothetical protein [Enterococcus durans]STP29145.1 Uncharacterised protein [Enterococcus durans]